MPRPKKTPVSQPDMTQQIAEAAYYNWLNRQHYVQTGCEFNDWIEAEKEILDSLKAKEAAAKLDSHPTALKPEKNKKYSLAS